MSKTYGGDNPAGYGHDKHGAGGGVAKNEGRVHVVHEEAKLKSAEPIKFTLDGREVEAQPGEGESLPLQRLGLGPEAEHARSQCPREDDLLRSRLRLHRR